MGAGEGLWEERRKSKCLPLLYDETKYLGNSDYSNLLSSITGDLKPKIKVSCRLTSEAERRICPMPLT